MLVAGTVVAIVAVVFVVVGALLPSRWRASRTTDVRASPEEIYPLIADFARGWPRWSPFGRAEDPAIEFTYLGAESGVGARQSWKSRKLGEGTMVISRADPEKGITFELATQGFTLTGTLELQRLSEGARLTWTDEGDVGRNILFRYLTLLFADRIVGKNLARGLANIRALVEARERSAVA